jgi:hypothetical protein
MTTKRGLSLCVALATAPSSCSNTFSIIRLGHFPNLHPHPNFAGEAERCCVRFAFPTALLPETRQ